MDAIEASWERREPHHQLSLDEVRTVLPSATGLELLGRGKANTNYRVARGEHEPVVLRLYQRDARARAVEARVLGLVDVPRPQMLGTGAVGGLPYAITRFCEGLHPEAVLTQVRPERVGRLCGLALAEIGKVRFDAHGLLDAEGYTRTFDSITASFDDLVRWSVERGRAGRRLSAEQRAGLLAVVASSASIFAGLDAQPRLVHGDFKFANLLVLGDGSAMGGVLDWEFACAFTPLLDLAIFTRHAARFPDGLLEGFEGGYLDGGGVLPAEWRRLARVLDLMNLVGFLNAGKGRPRLEAAVLPLIDEAIRSAR